MAAGLKDSDLVKYIRDAVRDTRVSAGLLSFILQNRPVRSILMYPYADYPQMRHIGVSVQTLTKLNQVVCNINWRLVLTDTALHIEQCNAASSSRQNLYNIITQDAAVQSELNTLGIGIPITGTQALHITLCPKDAVQQNLPDELVTAFKRGISINVTGVALGFSLDYAKFSWFMAIEVDIQKTIDIVNLMCNVECQANSHITIATVLR